jgi:hypothetical protein
VLVVPPAPDISTLTVAATLPVPANLPIPAMLEVSPSPDLSVAVDLLPALGLEPALHVPSALTPLCLGHAHRRLSPRLLELVAGPCAVLGAPRTATRLGGQ